MDISDQATAREEQERVLATKIRKPEGPPAVGWCLHCETAVPDGYRWCGPECRDDWDRGHG
jgi:hypothetical protein